MNTSSEPNAAGDESSEEIPKPAPEPEPPAGSNETPPSKRKRAVTAADLPPLLDRPLTDYGNAERLVAWHGKDLRFCPSLGWLVWDGKRWTRDETHEVMRRAKRTVRTMRLQASSIGDKDSGEHALASERVERLKAMITLAESEPTIVVTACMLDVDPWLLNVRNGTIDLRTGELREHVREDLLTKIAPVRYDPKAECPRWERFSIRSAACHIPRGS